MALQRDCSFPFCVVGPVLLDALRRFAETCFSEAMGCRRINWVRSVICSRLDARPPRVAPWVLALEVIEPWSDLSSLGFPAKAPWQSPAHCYSGCLLYTSDAADE